MIRGFILVSAWLLPTTVWAACVEAPAPGVPRHLRQSVALTLVRAAGLTGDLSDGQGLQLGQSHRNTACLPTDDPTGVLTDAAMLAQYQADEAARQAAAQVDAARRQAFADELAGNDYCGGEFGELEGRIDTALDTWLVARQAEVDAAANTVAGMKTWAKTQLLPGIRTALDVGLTKLAKCLRAERYQSEHAP